MNTTNFFPIDYKSLKKGDIIPINRIEEITGAKHGTSKYDFSCLKLKGRIESELRELGYIWTIAGVDGNLKILTDPEAAIYNHREQVAARRRQLRRFELQQHVDSAILPEDQKQQHERRLEINGRYIQSMLDTRKQLSLESYKRIVPGLPLTRGTHT